jgi:ferritin heavy chain
MSTINIRQNFDQESEEGINTQINMELYASYVYLSMVSKILILANVLDLGF